MSFNVKKFNLSLDVRSSLVRWGASVASGIFLGIPFIFPSLWPLACVGLVPSLLIIRRSPNFAFASGLVVGVLLVGFSLLFLFEAVPGDSFQVSSLNEWYVFVSIVWLLTSLFLGVFVAFWFKLAHQYLASSTLSFLLLGPLLWVFFEWLRSFAFSIFMLGPGSTMGAALSFGFAGYTIATSPLLVWSKVFGVYGLSGLLIFINIAIFFLFRIVKFTHRMYILGLAVTPLIVGIMLGPVVEIRSVEKFTFNDVSFVPISIDLFDGVREEERINRANLLISRIEDSLLKESDPMVLVLPENSNLIQNLTLLSEVERSRFDTATEGRDVLIVDSGDVPLDGGRYANGIFFWHPDGGIVAAGYKRNVIPFGEYMPWLYRFIFGTIKGISPFDIEAEIPFQNQHKDATYTFKNVSVGALACSEIYNPLTYKKLSEKQMDVLINVASHATFQGENTLLWPQVVAMARIHASWTGKPYIQASQKATSLIVVPRW